ncbi:glycosyltransferase [Clostridium sp. CTA-7]
MHILVIPSAYPTLENPLSSIFYKEQAKAIQEAGNKVGVIFSETRRVSGINFNSFNKNHFQIRKYIEDGLTTYRLHGWNIFTMRGTLGVDLWVKQSLKLFHKYIESEGKPDIIHVHSALYGGLVGMNIKKLYNIPYVITEHSSSVLKYELRKHDLPILKSVYDYADRIISVGEALKESINKHSKNYVEVIPNIVDIEKFNINKNTIKENFNFISISHLKENKNIDLTIRALYKVIKVYNNVKLTIVGDGPEKQNLIDLVNKLGISENVEFVGAVSREELNKYINRSNAFVLPSKYETFGIVYIEALSCGIPIITTKCGGPEDFYNEDIGYMIESEDEDILKDVMIEMIENINRFDPNTLRKYVESKFSKKVISNKIIAVYKDILNKNGDNNE